MISPLNTPIYASAPMEKLSPILKGDHTNKSSSSAMIGCKDDLLLRINTTINTPAIKGLKPSFESTISPHNFIASHDIEKHSKNEENMEESNASVSPFIPVGSSMSLRRLKRKLFLQRVSASKTTPRTSTSSSVSDGCDSTRTSTTSTRTSSPSIGDKEVRKMLVERLFRGSVSHN